MNKVRIHLDTDLGADADDLCALLYLLRNPGVEVTGITTVLERDGRRSAYAQGLLRLEERCADIQKRSVYPVPVAAGADFTLSGDKEYDFTFLHEERMFGRSFADRREADRRGPEDTAQAAVDQIHNSLEKGAVIVAVGPLTNLALFDRKYPGRLGRDNLFVMGGCFHRPEAGRPQWGPGNDWNLHMDLAAAGYILNRVPLTLVEVAATLKVFLTERDACILDGGDAFCRLAAHQGREWRKVAGFIEEAAAACVKLPEDLLNFHYDPLTAAVAAGYGAVVSEERRIRFTGCGGETVYRIEPDERGNPVRIITDVDGADFNRHWLNTVMAGCSLRGGCSD